MTTPRAALDISPPEADNLGVPESLYQRRIHRAEKLAEEYPASAEILNFLVQVLRFQHELSIALEKGLKNGKRNISFLDPIASELAPKFPKFLAMIEKSGPAQVAEEARRLSKGSDEANFELLSTFWTRADTSAALAGQPEFLARAFLQPYAEVVRSRAGKQHYEHTPRLCPFCFRKPVVGVLRPMGDGGQRSLVCSFCLAEWEFRRIVCPGCGEESEPKLPVYIAEEFNHVRVECCESCRTYTKTVDLTRNGLADPVVDEIAAIPLDLWAQQQGYTKLQTNLMLM